MRARNPSTASVRLQPSVTCFRKISPRKATYWRISSGCGNAWLPIRSGSEVVAAERLVSAAGMATKGARPWSGHCRHVGRMRDTALARQWKLPRATLQEMGSRGLAGNKRGRRGSHRPTNTAGSRRIQSRCRRDSSPNPDRADSSTFGRDSWSPARGTPGCRRHGHIPGPRGSRCPLRRRCTPCCSRNLKCSCRGRGCFHRRTLPRSPCDHCRIACGTASWHTPRQMRRPRRGRRRSCSHIDSSH